MRRTVFFLVAAIVVVLDQLTKHWVVSTLPMDDSRQLIAGFLYLTHTTNTGAAFGVLPHATYLLALAAFVAAAGIVVYAWRSSWPLPMWIGIGLALPLGGAVGNLIDRVRLGHVVDFIEVLLGSYTWPIFNIADSSICIGVGILVLVAVRSPAQIQPAQEKTHSLP